MCIGIASERGRFTKMGLPFHETGKRLVAVRKCLTLACSETPLQLYGRERVAELCRFLLQVLQLALAEALGICRRPNVVVGHPMFEQVIHGPRDFMGGRYQGLCGAKPSFEASIERAKGAMGARHRLGGHAEDFLPFVNLNLSNYPICTTDVRRCRVAS